PTRGAPTLGTFKEISPVLAGLEDGRADEGPAGGPATLAGPSLPRAPGWRAPGTEGDGRAVDATTDVPDPYGSAEPPPTTPDDTDPAGKRGPAGEGATAEEGKQ